MIPAALLVGAPVIALAIVIPTAMATTSDAATTPDSRSNERHVLSCNGDIPLTPDNWLTATATVDGHGKVITSGTIEDPAMSTIDRGDAYVSVHDSVVMLNGRWVNADGMVYTCVHSIDLAAGPSLLA